MPDDRVGSPAGGAPAPQIPVSPNNPCPFLRALVAGGFVDGHIVPLPKLTGTIEAATGEKGLKERLAGLKIYLVALIANGLSPLRLLRSWWSGAVLDQLRNGPLDKHGVGSRILNAEGQVDEAEIARLAGFGTDCRDPSGGTERGLTAQEITTYMDANFSRAKDTRRWYDRRLMNGEWPVLLNIMGKGEGKERYLGVSEVRTLFVERRLPERIAARLSSQPVPARGGPLRMFGKAAIWIIAIGFGTIVALAEFPDQVRAILPPPLNQFLPPPLPEPVPVKEARWLDQNWPTADRHWFHHTSQGTATFPVPYDWFVALEQPRIHLFSQPGLFKDSDYLERFGFIPSPKSIHADEGSLRRFGYLQSSDTTPAPTSFPGLPPVENFDGLPVGFARLTGAKNPGTDLAEPDKIGLTCAACHTGSLRYKGISVRFDGGPAMVDLRKLESATGLSIFYTLKVWGRFERFANRVLGPGASPEQRNQLRKQLTAVLDYLFGQKKIYDKTIADKGQKDTEEGSGRLDALNRIGNQVFYTDLALGGLSGFEKNLHADDAPVSFPPIWTVPWFLWAQYDASIEQPLIRNAGEALGVAALVNLSPDSSPGSLFRSSVAIDNLDRIEKMLRGPEPFGRTPKRFGGLMAPKWPSEVFLGDLAWGLNPTRVAKGRAIYAEICVECHLGPVDDQTFDTQFPEKSFWSSDRWKNPGGPNPVLVPVQKSVAGMGTDPGQANVLALRKVDVPGFFGLQATRDLGTKWKCSGITDPPTTEMPYSLALMMVVDRVSTKWMEDHPVDNPSEFWGTRQNCPNPQLGPHYRARPLNGIWATAPYLHNGSVPSLYWLLKPAADRPKKFCIGSRDFDPQQVGFAVTTNCAKGETLFSTTNADGSAILGNSVLGHSLEGTPGPDKPGVIGRMLTEEERHDLIEYLKTL